MQPKVQLKSNKHFIPNHQAHLLEATRTNAAVSKAATTLSNRISQLKERGIIRESLVPMSTEFEVLEFYGDAVLHERVSRFIVQTRRFMSPQLMSTLRTYIIKNFNLAQVFDSLQLASLLPGKDILMIGNNIKAKADIVEALIGEMAESRDPAVESVLTELLAYISYVGERSYHGITQNENAISAPAAPPYTHNKSQYANGHAQGHITSQPLRHNFAHSESHSKESQAVTAAHTDSKKQDDGQILLYGDPPPVITSAQAKGQAQTTGPSHATSKSSKKKKHHGGESSHSQLHSRGQDTTKPSFRTTRTLSASGENAVPLMAQEVRQPPDNAAPILFRTNSPNPSSVSSPLSNVKCVTQEVIGSRQIREFKQNPTAVLPCR